MKPSTPLPESPLERSEAAREKLQRMGIRLAPRGAWKKSFGSMKDNEHFAEAIRLGAEWRAEVNRKSLQGEDADT